MERSLVRSFLPSGMAVPSREYRARLGLGSYVGVADRGMESAANLQALRDGSIEHVIATDSGEAPRTPRSPEPAAAST